MPCPAGFLPFSFDDIPNWRFDDASTAYLAFRRSAEHAAYKPYKTGALGVAFDAFRAAYDEALRNPVLDREQARLFFERHFVPALVLSHSANRG